MIISHGLIFFAMKPKQIIVSLSKTLVVLCLCAFSSSAQKLSLKRYDVADGLTNSVVKSIYQDKKGFIWISTQEGLSRFDGYGFVNYGVRDGLGQQIVNDVREDKQGRFWAATNGGGVSLFIDSQTETPIGLKVKATEKFISFRVGKNSSANYVNRIYFDSQNNLWCLTDYGLYRTLVNDLTNLKFETVVEKKSGSSSALIEDSNRRIWFGLDSELFEINNGQIISHGSVSEGAGVQMGGSGEYGNFITGIVETKDGLLISTLMALYKFNPPNENSKSAQWQKQPLTLKDQTIYNMFEDSNGGVWFGTHGKNTGVIKYKNEQQRLYSKPQGIEYGITTLAEDNDGNLWFGTNGGGVYKFSSEAFISYTKDSLPLNALDVLENHERKCLAVLADLSWVEITKSGIKPLPKMEYAPSFSRYAFIKFTNGEWTWNGGWYETKINQPVIQLRNGQKVSLKKSFTIEDLSKGIHYYEDQNGLLWVVSGNKVYRSESLLTQTLSYYVSLPKDSLLEGSKPQIVLDKIGSLWFGSSEGLCRLREKQFNCFQPIKGLPTIDPRSLFVDSRGWLWIGLRFNGISVTKNPQDDEPQFINFTDELPSNAVWSIAEDNSGKLYFGTEKGLVQFDIEKNLWQYFNSKNGLSSDRIGSLAKDSQGNIWIVTASGLTRFNPKEERKGNRPPPIYLSRVNIAGENLPLAETGVNEIPLIELQATRNNLAIEFVGLNFTSEDNLSYQYKLEGVDTDWSVPTKQRFVNYARLSAGNYRFLVRSINREGIVSITPASFKFRILPPVWQRWWFIASLLIITIVVIYGVYRYRVSRLLEMERMRTRIATDLHDDIGANLTRIALLSELANQQSGSKNEKPNLLPHIADIARESVASMNDIVWAISPEHDRLLDLTRRMRQHAEDVFTFREIDLDFNAPSSDSDLKLSVGVRRDLLLIFKEAVNNAARHSNSSQVSVEFVVKNSVLILQVKDNGRGIDSSIETDGQGLRSMKRRASSLGGELKIDSQTNYGTTITFELPLQKVSSV